MSLQNNHLPNDAQEMDKMAKIAPYIMLGIAPLSFLFYYYALKKFIIRNGSITTQTLTHNFKMLMLVYVSYQVLVYFYPTIINSSLFFILLGYIFAAEKYRPTTMAIKKKQ